MVDYLTMLQNISEAYLASTCLYDFLGAVGRLTGIHLGLMDNDFDDPARTNPIEPDAYTGPMKPCIPLIVENTKRGYLSIPQETELTEELRPILKLTAAFVKQELGGKYRTFLLPYHRLGESKLESLEEAKGFLGIRPPSDEHMQHLKAIFDSLELECQIGG